MQHTIDRSDAWYVKLAFAVGTAFLWTIIGLAIAAAWLATRLWRLAGALFFVGCYAALATTITLLIFQAVGKNLDVSQVYAGVLGGLAWLKILGD